MNKDNTLEVNSAHPIVVKLNQLRKRDGAKATLLAKQMLENVMLASGIPYNMQESTKRNLDVLNEYLRKKTEDIEKAKPKEMATVLKEKSMVLKEKPNKDRVKQKKQEKKLEVEFKDAPKKQ